ncbi:hypothetical protein GCM10022408_11640 [Hymenobacter fastidiosus]|uniref:Uncharacterized protein n=1 Tax=Hymenobacter fastidiosus TaxID=486264 RepID=A0ABP7RU77_9BACT
MLRLCRLSVVGVSNNADPVAAVRGTEGTSRKHKRPDLITCRFQVRKHAVEAQRDVASNVLTKEPAEPALGKNPKYFRPEPAVIRRAVPLPGAALGLAGVAGGNNVTSWEVVGIVDIEELFVGHKGSAAGRQRYRTGLFRPPRR